MITQFESMWNDHPGSFKAVQHRIKFDKTDSQPMNLALIKQGQTEREFEKQEINRMLPMDGIQPSETRCASSIVFVPKKYSTLRFHVDYRTLKHSNNRGVAQGTAHGQFIDWLGEATKFSTLGANTAHIGSQFGP